MVVILIGSLTLMTISEHAIHWALTNGLISEHEVLELSFEDSKAIVALYVEERKRKNLGPPICESKYYPFRMDYFDQTGRQRRHPLN